MKRAVLIAAAFGVVLMASPAFAQSRSVDVIGYIAWADPNADGVLRRAGDDINVDFDSERGFGVAVNVFWGNRISTEFAASVIEPDVAFRSSNPALPVFTGGSLEMIPITVTLQYHFNPNGRIDPYIGAGAAYVLFDQLDTGSDLNDINLRSIDFDDDVGFVVNAGLSIDITPRFALYLDAKYVPVGTSANAVFATGPGATADIDVNPLIISAGLGFQF
jgi:outer membrane protein